MPPLPIGYDEFLRYLRRMDRMGIDTSETGGRLLAYASGVNNLQGHVKQAFYGVQLFLIRNRRLIGSIARYDISKPFPLKGRILSKWAHFLRNTTSRTPEYDLQVLRNILPTHAGGVQRNSRGAIAEVRRSLVPVAQLLIKKGYPGGSVDNDLDSDSDGAPGRRRQTIMRTIRDTEMVKNLKEFYGFACQVCRYPSVRIGAQKFYVEGHHLRPLGGIHNGTDTKDNIILLCPNHHVLFDNFAVSIDPADCRTVVSREKGLSGRRLLTRHRLRKENVFYHYQRFLSSQL